MSNPCCLTCYLSTVFHQWPMLFSFVFRRSIPKELSCHRQDDPEATVSGVCTHLPPTFPRSSKPWRRGTLEHIVQALHLFCSGVQLDWQARAAATGRAYWEAHIQGSVSWSQRALKGAESNLLCMHIVRGHGWKHFPPSACVHSPTWPSCLSYTQFVLLLVSVISAAFYKAAVMANQEGLPRQVLWDFLSNTAHFMFCCISSAHALHCTPPSLSVMPTAPHLLVIVS